MVVVLPAPLGPRKPTISPSRDAERDAAHRLDRAEALASRSRTSSIARAHGSGRYQQIGARSAAVSSSRRASAAAAPVKSLSNVRSLGTAIDPRPAATRRGSAALRVLDRAHAAGASPSAAAAARYASGAGFAGRSPRARSPRRSSASRSAAPACTAASARVELVTTASGHAVRAGARGTRAPPASPARPPRSDRGTPRPSRARSVGGVDRQRPAPAGVLRARPRPR